MPQGDARRAGLVSTGHAAGCWAGGEGRSLQLASAAPGQAPHRQAEHHDDPVAGARVSTLGALEERMSRRPSVCTRSAISPTGSPSGPASASTCARARCPPQRSRPRVGVPEHVGILQSACRAGRASARLRQHLRRCSARGAAWACWQSVLGCFGASNGRMARRPEPVRASRIRPPAGRSLPLPAPARAVRHSHHKARGAHGNKPIRVRT